VSERVGLSRPVEIDSAVISRFYVGRKTHPSYVESTDDSLMPVGVTACRLLIGVIQVLIS